MSFSRICLIGFGEVGQILGEDLAGPGVELSAFDIAFDQPDSIPSRALSSHEVRAGRTAAEAAEGAELIISAVTAAEDLAAAQSVTAALESNAAFLDLNSASPGQKRASALVIERAGGIYVEAAVMSPFSPKRLGSPMLLGGAHVEDVLPALQALGFSGARAYAQTVGQAAATKLCRSVMIKGVEALLTESMLAARRYGVEREVLASLSDLLPIPDWPATARYMISRSLEHGTRRAEEMREAARTVQEAGVEPLMAQATAERQDWAAAFRAAVEAKDLEGMLDAVLADISPVRGAA